MNARLRLLPACVLALSALSAQAEKVPLTDEQLGQVHGQGVSIAVHLVLNGSLLSGQNPDSRWSAGFAVNGTTTYVIAQNLGGILDLLSIGLDPSVNANGQSYLAISMPAFVGAQEFGVRALAVQTDPAAPITASLGSVLLNGAASMTGQLNVWSK